MRSPRKIGSWFWTCALLLLSNAACAQGPPTPAREGFFSAAFSSAAPGGALALILPLSGPLAATGAAVRDGFLAAAAESGAQVRVFDSGSGVDQASPVFREALRSGPSLIVGPLRKEAVQAIAMEHPGAPWLALNYLDAPIPVDGLVQFGLRPEDEGRAAADDAYQRGLRRALALIPQSTVNSDWGERALAAFSTRIAELGGAVIASAHYVPGTSNFGEPIRQLLGILDSEQRHRALVSTLGERSEFEARRRDDADFIFLAAKPADGRLLWPQLRFHRSGSLPVYATSAIFEGRRDAELNGLRLCDIPYLGAAEDKMAELREQVATLDSARRQPRFFAMGHDAFALAQAIRNNVVQEPVPGLTGILLLQGGAILRQLSCMEIRDGRPVARKRA